MGALVAAICLLLISFLDCERRYLAVFLLTIGVAFTGLILSGGHVVNVGDYSGVHSGVLFGISNTVSSIGGFSAPYLTSIITKHKTAIQWRAAFMLYAASFLISAIVFTLFARGETEPWARDDIQYEKISTDDQNEDKELIEVISKKAIV